MAHLPPEHNSTLDNTFYRERAKKKEKTEEDIVLETALDFEDKYKNQLKEFKFASRTASEKEQNNYKSVDRIMDKKLILLIKNKTNGEWEFPSVEWQEGESLREVCSSLLVIRTTLFKGCFYFNRLPNVH